MGRGEERAGQVEERKGGMERGVEREGDRKRRGWIGIGRGGKR